MKPKFVIEITKFNSENNSLSLDLLVTNNYKELDNVSFNYEFYDENGELVITKVYTETKILLGDNIITKVFDNLPTNVDNIKIIVQEFE